MWVQLENSKFEQECEFLSTGHVNQQLAMIEQVQAKFGRQFQDFDQQLGQIWKSQAIKLKWSEGTREDAWSNADTHGITLYVKFASSTIVC